MESCLPCGARKHIEQAAFLLVVMLVLTVAGAECTKLPSFEQLEEEQHATCFPVTAPTAGSRAATAASGGGQNYAPLPLHTKEACMIHEMLQYMVQEYLFRSIVRGDVQSDADFMCEALPGALKESILIGKGLLTKIACMIYGILQNMVQEYLFRSFGRGAVQSEADFFCEAVPGALKENIVLGKGFFTKVASMIYGMLQNMVQEYLFRSIVRGTVQPETNFICEALPGALKENIFICKGLFHQGRMQDL